MKKYTFQVDGKGPKFTTSATNEETAKQMLQNAFGMPVSCLQLCPSLNLQKPLNAKKLRAFVKSYLNSAVWADLEGSIATQCEEFTRDAKRRAAIDCRLFLDKILEIHGAKCLLTLLRPEYSTAHDFWLTRNGHGVGFWDRPEMYGEEMAKSLTGLAQTFPNVGIFHIKGKKSKLIIE